MIGIVCKSNIKYLSTHFHITFYFEGFVLFVTHKNINIGHEYGIQKNSL